MADGDLLFILLFKSCFIFSGWNWTFLKFYPRCLSPSSFLFLIQCTGAVSILVSLRVSFFLFLFLVLRNILKLWLFLRLTKQCCSVLECKQKRRRRRQEIKPVVSYSFVLASWESIPGTRGMKWEDMLEATPVKIHIEGKLRVVSLPIGMF